MNDFDLKLNKLLGELNEIRAKISNLSDSNVTINTNSTIIYRIDELERVIPGLEIFIADYRNQREAELRSSTLPILADEEIVFENLHQ